MEWNRTREHGMGDRWNGTGQESMEWETDGMEQDKRAWNGKQMEWNRTREHGMGDMEWNRTREHGMEQGKRAWNETTHPSTDSVHSFNMKVVPVAPVINKPGRREKQPLRRLAEVQPVLLTHLYPKTSSTQMTETAMMTTEA